MEDNPSDQILLNKLLLDFKILSEVASSVTEAINKLTVENYDLILLDLQLGKESGLDLLRWANTNKISSNIYVTSGKKTSKDVMEAIQLGANDYMVKPIDKEIFGSKINALKEKNNLPSDWFEYLLNEDLKNKGHIFSPCSLYSINEIGVSFISNYPIPKGESLLVDIPLFKENGISKNLLKISECKVYGDKYKIFLSYIGFSESDRQIIRLICKKLKPLT